jgi:hypothetical protein
MSIGMIFASTGRLALRTAARGLSLALLVLVPLHILLGTVARRYFLDAATIMSGYAGKGDEATPELMARMIEQIVGASMSLFAVILLLVLGFTVAQLAITIESWDHAVGLVRSVREWLARVFGRPLATTLTQVLILILLVGAFVFAALLFATALTAVSGEIGTTFILFVVVAIAGYFGVATVFRLHEIVADERGPWRSLISSIALARGHWAKVFFTIVPAALVYYLVAETIGSLVTGRLTDPPIFSDTANDIGSLVEMYRFMANQSSPAQSTVFGIISALGLFLVVNLVTALYVDLRARRGDFDFEEGEVEMEDGEDSAV